MDEGAVEAGERDHVADRAERHEVEPLQQRRLGPRGEGTPLAQHAGDRHQDDEGDADGRQMLERARLVDPVGVDHGQGGGERLLASMMVDHDHLEPQLGGLAQRLERGGAGVQRDDQAAATLGELGQDARIRPVAVAHPVGDLDLDRDAERAQVARHQCGRGGPVDVVVADQAHPLRRQNRRGQPLGGAIEIVQVRRVGQPVAHARVEVRRRLAGADAAPGQHAAEHLGHPVLLADRQRRRLVAGAQPPAPPENAALDLHPFSLPVASGF